MTTIKTRKGDRLIVWRKTKSGRAIVHTEILKDGDVVQVVRAKGKS